MVNWSLTVSSEIDQRLRAFLEQKGVNQESFSQYIEDAVKQKLDFEETVSSVQERNLCYSEQEIEANIDEAIKETRAASRS